MCCCKQFRLSEERKNPQCGNVAITNLRTEKESYFIAKLPKRVIE